MTEMKVDYIHIILRGGLLAIVCTLLSVVWVNDPMLPAGVRTMGLSGKGRYGGCYRTFIVGFCLL